jgi:hypothetical protein
MRALRRLALVGGGPWLTCCSRSRPRCVRVGQQLFETHPGLRPDAGRALVLLRSSPPPDVRRRLAELGRAPPPPRTLRYAARLLDLAAGGWVRGDAESPVVNYLGSARRRPAGRSPAGRLASAGA